MIVHGSYRDPDADDWNLDKAFGAYESRKKLELLKTKRAQFDAQLNLWEEVDQTFYWFEEFLCWLSGGELNSGGYRVANMKCAVDCHTRMMWEFE